jgi:hypothetical protein
MATRMQQRRGTAAQWISTNSGNGPVLNAGEIGFESDNNRFKIGDGVNHWVDLPYFANNEEVSALIDGAPELLNTLNELAAAVNDDPAFFTTVANDLNLKAPKANPTFTGTVSGVTKAHVGLGNVDNTSDANKPVSTAQASAIATVTNQVGVLSTSLYDHEELTTGVHGIADTADLATITYVDTAVGNAAVDQASLAGTGIDYNISTDQFDIDSTVATKTYVTDEIGTHSSDTTSVHGIDDTAALATKDYADDAVSTHSSDTSSVHGIADTTQLVTLTGTETLSNKTLTSPTINAGTASETIQNASAGVTFLSSNQIKLYGDLTWGYTESAVYAYAEQTGLDLEIVISGGTPADGTYHVTANIDQNYQDSIWQVTETITPVSQFTATVLLRTASASVTISSVEIGSLEGVASNVQNQLDAKAPIENPTFTGVVSGVTKDHVGLANADNTSDADKPVSTAAQTALDLKAPLANPTFTGTVSGVTKSHVGLGNLDNTSDANKPVSTATQTALDAKASLSGATFTGSVEIDQNLVVDGNLTVNGTAFNASSTSIVIEDNMVQLAHSNAANTVDLGIVVGYNDGASKHSGIVRDVSADKWKLFKGVTTEPTTTVDFSEGSLDALQVGALEATTVTPSSGVVFSDGTQTKEGIPSRTIIIQKTSSYTLSNLDERDELIEMGSSSGITLTIPTDSTLNFPIGTSIDILQTSTGQVTIAGAGGVTVNATPGLKLRTTWSSATLFKRAANTWVVYGDLTV